jgi:hypothetical protein
MNPSFAEADPRTTTPVRDLSATGVFVQTDQLYPLGSRIELRFVVFPAAPRLFRHTGRITRHSHQPPGMGVEFDPVPPDTLRLIDDILRLAAPPRDSDEVRAHRARRVVFSAAELRATVIDGD